MHMPRLPRFCQDGTDVLIHAHAKTSMNFIDEEKQWSVKTCCRLPWISFLCMLLMFAQFQKFQKRPALKSVQVQSQMHSNLCILANTMHLDDEDHAPDELEDTETQVAAPVDAVAPSCHRCNDDLGGDGGCASCTAAGYAPARGHGFALSSERQRPPAEPRLPHDGHREDQRFHMEGLEEIDD